MGGREGGSSAALYVLDGSLLRAAGQVNGIATLDASGRVPTDQLPASVYYYQGMWNASTDTPHLAGTTPTIGYAWSVSVAGTTTLGAISSWAVGDFAVYGALGWSKIPAGGVQTFNGRSGAVVPVAGDYDGLALNLAAASSFVAPASAAAAPTTSASVAFDTTSKHLKVGDGSTSLTVLDSSSIGVTVQAQSAALAAIAGNGTPTAWGLARMLDADQAANRTALGLGTAAYISSTAGGDLSGTLPSPTVAKVAGTTPGAVGLSVLASVTTADSKTALSLANLAYLNTVGTTQIDDASVTLAKMANLDTDRLIGRDTTGTGVPESLTVGGGLEFTGSGGIQRSALSGDVAASAGSGTTTIGANKVTDAMLRQSAGLSVVGRSGNSTGNVADITGTDGGVLRVSGTSLGFGTIPVSSVTGAFAGTAQAVSGDTVLSSQVTAINVSASCTITLPTVASWTLATPTQINVNGSSALTVKLAANAADKIEAAANVYLYARRGIYILMPTAANRWEVYAVCGELIIPIMGTDLSTASGGSPWTFTDSVSGASIVFTDRSSASSNMTASSGLLGAPATGTAYFNAASATGAVATTPLSGITDAWSRPLSLADRFYFAVQTVRVASAGTGIVPLVALGGDVLSEGPRFGVVDDLSATLSLKARQNSTSPTVDLTTAATTSSAWFGALWGGTADQTLSRGFLTTSAPAGMMGVTWIPQAYEDTSQGRLTPPANPTGYTLVATDQLVYAVTGTTTGTTFRATAIAVSLYRGYPS